MPAITPLLPSARVGVVDDNPVNVALLESILEEAGRAQVIGLIDTMGDWAIGQAIRDARDWDGLCVAVNALVRQLGKPRLHDAVAEATSQGLDADRLELDVTENTVMENVDQAVGALTSPRDMGDDRAIDDLGTGYSSLAYPSRLTPQVAPTAAPDPRS